MADLTIADYLKYADLQMAAEALYRFNAKVNADTLTPGDHFVGPVPIDVLTTGNLHASKFTATDAQQFASEWTVVDHISNTATGFSGTLFQNSRTHELVISLRSTEFLDDAARDNQATNVMEIKEFGFAFGQIADMEAWYQSLKDSGKLPANQNFSVTGYSLGGHLAMAFKRLFPTIATDVFAVNGLGFKLGNATVDSLFAALGGAPAFNGSVIENVYGIAGPELAAMNNFALQQPGGWDGIYIESISPADPARLGHGAAQMTDSLAIYSLYAKLSPALQLGAITDIIKASSTANATSLEAALDALRTLLIDGDIAKNTSKQTPTDNRDKFYENLYALQKHSNYTTLSGRAGLTLLAGQGGSTLASQGKTDFGRFLALDYLLPFALDGASSVLIPTHQARYDAWQADQSLTPEQKAAGEANYSDRWYAERARMLGYWLDNSRSDGQRQVDRSLPANRYYEDQARGISFSVDRTSNTSPANTVKPMYIFGSDGDDPITGQGDHDVLFGGPAKVSRGGTPRNETWRRAA